MAKLKEPTTPISKRELVGTGEGMKSYDKFLVRVNRIQKKKGKKSVGVTQSVDIDKLMRSGIKVHPEVALKMNTSGIDHQNSSQGGQPIIIQYFESGTVKTGQRLKANDIYAKDDEGESTGDIIGLNIDVSKLID